MMADADEACVAVACGKINTGIQRDIVFDNQFTATLDKDIGKDCDIVADDTCAHRIMHMKAVHDGDMIADRDAVGSVDSDIGINGHIVTA